MKVSFIEFDKAALNNEGSIPVIIEMANEKFCEGMYLKQTVLLFKKGTKVILVRKRNVFKIETFLRVF